VAAEGEIGREKQGQGVTAAGLHRDDQLRVIGPRAYGDEGLLLEHSRYVVRWPGADTLLAQSREIHEPGEGVFVLELKSETGLLVLSASAGGTPLPGARRFEVVSTKLGSLTSYRRFAEVLATNLFERASGLVLRAKAAPTAHGIADGERTSVLFALHHFLERGDAIRAAVRTIVERPHVALAETREPTPLGAVSDLDLDVLFEVAVGGGPRQRVAGRGPLRDAPLEVWARRGIETTDCPENRFAKWAVARWLRALGEVLGHPALANMPDTRRARLVVLQTALHEARRHATFDGVGTMRRIPQESRVISRRDGYRVLLPLLRELGQGRSLVFGQAERAIEQRELWRLYEIWTFFRVVDEISAALGCACEVVTRPDEIAGLEWNAKAKWPGHGRLLYNATRSGYAVPLRPDLLWESEDPAVRVVFDAKFQTRIDPEDPSEAKSHDGPLHAMHVYRDGLGVRASVVLYPGSESRFFHTDRRDNHALPALAETLAGKHEGVGYWAMRPDDDARRN
jgi:predicted component of viral defense system (DUF524 family)